MAGRTICDGRPQPPEGNHGRKTTNTMRKSAPTTKVGRLIPRSVMIESTTSAPPPPHRPRPPFAAAPSIPAATPPSNAIKRATQPRVAETGSEDLTISATDQFSYWMEGPKSPRAARLI